MPNLLQECNDELDKLRLELNGVKEDIIFYQSNDNKQSKKILTLKQKIVDLYDIIEQQKDMIDEYSRGRRSPRLDRSLSLDSGSSEEDEYSDGHRSPKWRHTINVITDQDEQNIEIQLDIDSIDTIVSIKDKILSTLKSNDNFSDLTIKDIMVTPRVYSVDNQHIFDNTIAKIKALNIVRLLTNGDIKIHVNSYKDGMDSALEPTSSFGSDTTGSSSPPLSPHTPRGGSKRKKKKKRRNRRTNRR